MVKVRPVADSGSKIELSQMAVVQDFYNIADCFVIKVELSCSLMEKDCHVMYLRLKNKGLIVSLSSFSVYYHYSGMMVFEKVVMYGKVSKMLSGNDGSGGADGKMGFAYLRGIWYG